MSYLTDTTSLLDRLSLSSAQQRWFRLVALGCGLAFLVLVPLAGGGWHPVLTAVALVPLLSTVLLPESNAPLALMVYLGGLWVVTVPRSLGIEVLAAAVALGGLHVACLLASYGPPGLVLEPSFVALWRRRFGVGAAAAGLVWLLARGIAFLDLPASGAALGAALLLLLGWVGVLGVRLGDPPDS
jgi:hypothetical protein